MKHFFTSLKFMLSALLLCLAIGAQAGDVVFNGTTDTNGKPEAGEDQLTKNGVTLSVSNGLLASSDGQYRTYKGQTLTISSTVGAITKVVFTCTANNDTKYGPGCFTVASGNYSYEGKIGTWTGAANEVVFTAESNQVRATEIVVTVDGDTPVDPDPDPDPDPEPSATYTSIAAMKTAATADKTDVKFQFKDLLVTYVNGVYNYVSDGTDGFLFYGSSELVVGDKMTGSVTGKLYQYNGLNEMSDNSFTIDSKTSGNAVTAQNVDVASILSDYRNYESEYVKISGVTFNGALANGVTVSQNGSDLTLYNRFNLTYDVNTAHKYDIYGFPAIFKETIQLYVTQIVDQDGDTPGPGPQPSGDVIYENSFLGDEGNFTVVDATQLPEGLSYVWSNTNNYGWKASAYVNGVNYVTDSWLVSPAFTLGKEQSSIKFEHARKFGDLSQLSVNISTDKQNWTKLEVSAWPDGSSWDYVEATADISAFAGKTIYIGFRYTSTADAGATWEIKNFSVTSPGGSYEGEGPGPQPEAKTYTTIAAAKAAATADKVPSVLKFENVLVTYVNGLSTYLADDENGFLLYGNVENVATGDVVNIEVAGDLFLYNGMPELSVSEVKAVTTVSSGNVVTPVALEVADVVADPFKYSNMLVSFEGVNFLSEAFDNRNVSITQDGEELVVRDNWKSMTDESIKFSLTETYTVTGFVAMYKEAAQIYPRDINDIVSASAIRGVELDAATKNIYNLAGQKMESITRGGLYIVNGKKVLVK